MLNFCRGARVETTDRQKSLTSSLPVLEPSSKSQQSRDHAWGYEPMLTKERPAGRWTKLN